MKQVVILGSTGMLGTYATKYFKSKGYETYCPKFNVLKTPKETLQYIIQQTPYGEASAVINCIGMIKQRNSSQEEMIHINSLFPHVLSSVCDKVGVKMIHITTDCVFSGLTGNYSENSVHDATDIYGRSKSLGEPSNSTNIRTSIIGEELKNKLSFFEWAKSQSGKTCSGYTNHIWNGITCLELSKYMHELIERSLYWKGTKHIFSPHSYSKYQMLILFNNHYNLKLDIIDFKDKYEIDRTLSSDYESPIAIQSFHRQLIEMKGFLNEDFSSNSN
jgi:dTDP-4-dehydrorhamnose reductase